MAMSQRGEPGPTATNSLRPGRALIGWMAPQAAARFLSGRPSGTQPTTDEQARLERARAAVAARPEGVAQDGMVAPLPAELNQHVAQLRELAGHLFDLGWQPAMVDLSRVCAFQPVVCTDDLHQRMAGLVRESLASLADITFPLGPTPEYQTSFDPSRNAWLLSSPDPNLQVTTRFTGGPPPSLPHVRIYGFHVAMSRSVMEVGRYEGRWYLRDGYHRALALLRRGVRWAPSLVREFTELEKLLPSGMLPPAVFLGSRPPLLTSYLDDAVSADVMVTPQRKLIVLQATELRLNV